MNTLTDSLYCSGAACNQQYSYLNVAPVADVAAPAAPGSFPMNMGIPTGAMPMGIPTGMIMG